jgi:hypothetical protein
MFGPFGRPSRRNLQASITSRLLNVCFFNDNNVTLISSIPSSK